MVTLLTVWVSAAGGLAVKFVIAAVGGGDVCEPELV